MPVTYEWKAEKVDEHEDIVDMSFAKKLANLDMEINQVFAVKVNVCLVRDEHDLDGMLLDRSHGYINGGKMAETFDEGGSVPLRFRAEAGRFIKKQAERNAG